MLDAEQKLAAANRQIDALQDELRQRTDAARNSIMANIGHELRSPFNAIIGFTELILDKQFGDLTALQEEYLGYVIQSARNLFSLINDILDLTRDEADRLQLVPSLVKLDDLLSRCLVLVREKAAKHGIKLSTEINLVAETIEADEHKLKLILFNLLAGMLKSTPDGGEVWLKAEMTPENVCISVENTRSEIKEEDLEHLFGPFGLADAPSTHSCRTAQAGFFLTQKLVELHGGRIWAESGYEGKGASFRFLVPRKQDANDS